VKPALIAVLLGAAVAATQPIDASPPTDNEGPRPIGGLAFIDELEVTVVNVVVHVTGKGGRPVTDLTREDFRVFQDGVEQPITNFQLYTEEVYRSYFDQPDIPIPLAPTPAVADAQSTERIRPVYMVLYVDNENLTSIDRNRVLSQARNFVRENLHPPVKMMVVSYQRSLKILQPFTSDSREVLAALRSLRDHSSGYEEREATRRELIDGMQVNRQQQKMKGGDQVRTGWERGDFYQRIIAFAEEELNDLAFSVDALRTMISSVGGLEGKKGIIYISNGLPMVPGLDLFVLYSEVFGEQSILTQASRFDRTRLFTSLADSANAHDISFYTIGAGGLELVGKAGAKYAAPADTQTASIGADNYIDPLRFVAENTGGLAIVETNEIARGLEDVERDMYSYYSLGYRLEVSGGDKVHRIKVELPNNPGHKIRYRRRFVEKSIETRMQDTVVSGLVFDLDENPLMVELEIGDPTPASGDHWLVPFTLSVPRRNVALLPEREDYVGHLTLYVAARNVAGDQSDIVRQEHEVRVAAADYENERSERFAVTATLLMNVGKHSVVVGLLDTITRQSSFVTTSVAVGDTVGP
jgi:VWFA-related protein